ncbi:bifunctional 2-polyprenyl-6-hydroxyphenol methylase/3-demethylubiquinol 3-O-methyltransferase UbiG [Geothrix sp. 21YS21S-2]|uniref:class I SAM-dependent methyltransferase n=1 Tax=Geothrix sp. 21YS21S-2 TaxID=3068893 RepID=UPI0027BB1D3D|nr:class I SAM-dependent methyltransferase [Geothrix sp. 21YS21S-2]
MAIEDALEHPSCPICGATEARALLLAGDDWIPDGPAREQRFCVMRCARCRARYTSPRFSEATKHLAFEGAYPFYERARKAAGPPSPRETAAFLRRIELVTGVHPAPGRVLDLGMGDGLFLAAMRERGWDVEGVDIEPGVVAYARTHLGLPGCRVLDADREPFPPGPFDAVTLWGMFQLSYHPRELLEKIRPSLAPGGILAIGLSNIEGLGARLFGRHWRGLGLPRHLVHYTPGSLEALLVETGYRIQATAGETPDWIVDGSMNSACPLPGNLGRASRLAARSVLGWLGRGRLGDTFTVIAGGAGS